MAALEKKLRERSLHQSIPFILRITQPGAIRLGHYEQFIINNYKTQLLAFLSVIDSFESEVAISVIFMSVMQLKNDETNFVSSTRRILFLLALIVLSYHLVSLQKSNSESLIEACRGSARLC